MNKTSTIRHLKAAQKAIQAALDSLDDQPQNLRQIGTCVFCGDPIYEGERTPREVHVRCYALMNSRVNAEEATWEQFEKAGRVGPCRKSGRRKKAMPIDVSMAAEEPEGYEKPTKRAPKKKPRGGGKGG